jgi:uncharacterized protein with HEPN domain
MKNDSTYLRHILEAIEKTERYLSGTNYESFIHNDMMIDAVIRELMIIGEAANNLSDKFQVKHSDIMWWKIKGMRNVLVHEYFGVNLKIIWDTCKENLPTLKLLIQKALGM